MENVKFELIEVITHCCDVKTFRFALPKEIPYQAGQYLILTLNINGKDAPKAFSISSSPTEKGYIEFTKKLTGSEFSNSLNNLNPGDACAIRFPMGRFTFQGEYGKIAFLSGGIGITPIRSICKYATDAKLSTDIVVLYSSRTPEYLIFRNDFTVMERENKNLRVVYTLTQCNEKVSGCRMGAIDAQVIKEEVPDYLDRKFFICGPPGMVEAMKTTLLGKLSIPQENIITEDFTGY